MINISQVFSLDPNWMLDLCVLSSIIFGVCVVSSYNPMYSILYLIGLFISVAGYLYYINIGIMSLLYLLIYVGAIAILFLFILSLLDVKLSELKAQSWGQDFPFAFLIIIVVFYSFYHYYSKNVHLLSLSELKNYKYVSDYSDIFSVIDNKTIFDTFSNTDLSSNLSYLLVEDWYKLYPLNELSSVGNLLYTEYAFLFLLMGSILLLSIIGAIVVTTLKK